MGGTHAECLLGVVVGRCDDALDFGYCCGCVCGWWHIALVHDCNNMYNISIKLKKNQI